MKAIAENLYERGKNRTLYCRVRIPRSVLGAYPSAKTHHVVSLGTADVAEAKKRLRVRLTRFDAEHARHEKELGTADSKRSVQKLTSLSDEHLKTLAGHWIHQTLLTDERQRSQGMDDEEFNELESTLGEQRVELGKMLARGQSEKILPAMLSYLYLCGLDIQFSPVEAKRAGFIFLQAVVTGLDHRQSRNDGKVVGAESLAPPTTIALAVQAMKQPDADPTWEELFAAWRDHVPGRPKSTSIASRTPWNELQRFAAERLVSSPVGLTPQMMTDYVASMFARGLAVATLNERLLKVKAIFKIAVGLNILSVNPAASTLGKGSSSYQKRSASTRLSFDEDDVKAIFSSTIYLEHRRSSGQSGEATYWLPLLMYYTGARPEELAGLALCDIKQHETHGWYIDIKDSPEDGEANLLAEDEQLPVRLLKNGQSIRRVPIARELLDLGLLRYIDWVRAKGAKALFPTLRVDSHGKLSGSFSKFFGRFKKSIGITSPLKVFYSFRHTMKDLMEQAHVPSKYLKRIMGHTTGDGKVTDGYGGPLPFEHVVAEFGRVTFHPISARTWQPGKGKVNLRDGI